jgi:hypothetical protein
MHSSRLISIPIDHVVAEVAAFPLASEAALALRVSALDPQCAQPTASLWRHAERHLLGGFPAFSVDEVVAMRDKIWFHQTTAARPLHVYLRRLARQFLAVRGTTAVPVLPPDERPLAITDGVSAALARQRWRWLSLALPPDMLLAALRTPDRGPDTIELVSPALARHLEDYGYAETHLHLGAAIDFSLLWVGAIHAIADPALHADGFHSPSAALDEGRYLGPWLMRAALARYLLAVYLAWGAPGNNFFHFLMTVIRPFLSQARYVGAGHFALLLDSLSELQDGQLRPGVRPFAVYQSLYSDLTGLRRGPRLDSLAQARAADPIAPLFPQRLPAVWPEVHFIASALAYLESVTSPEGNLEDAFFAEIFWQVMHVRGLFYRHMVQRPMTPGLQWFIRFYGRLSPARRPLTLRTQLESAAVIGGIGRGLRSLEVRSSPPDDAAGQGISALREFVETTQQVATVWRDLVVLAGNDAPRPEDTLEIGLVFHFTKDRGGGAREGRPSAYWRGSHAEPRSNPTVYRYARYYNNKAREAGVLERLFEDSPRALAIVRGLDVCTDELGVPNWVLVPLLAEVRQAADAATLTVRQRYGSSAPALRMTAHAGEDFVHLLTGLRSVDEAIEYFPLREGDRIGHGLALGLEPREWAQRAGRLPMLREERLFDLVWKWAWYGREGGAPDRERQQLLEHEIAEHTAAIFDERLTPYDLELLVHDLFTLAQRGTLAYAARFPNGPSPFRVGAEAPDRLGYLCRYLQNPTTFARGRDIVWIDPSAEREELAYLQNELRRKVGLRGITVEVNPTSNLLIGDLGDLTAHPLWRLRPPRPSTVDAPPVTVCVGSDDPVVFGSDLRQEYQCLSDALALAGLSDEEARQWLDRTRTSGLESRFTFRSGVP